MNHTQNLQFQELTESDIRHIKSVCHSSGLQFTDLELDICFEEMTVDLYSDDFHLSIYRTNRGYFLQTTEYVVSDENDEKVYEELREEEEDDEGLFKLTEWINPHLEGVNGPLRISPPKTKVIEHDFFIWDRPSDV